MSGPSPNQPKQWRDLYNSALRECGDWSLRNLKADIAMSVCVQRLSEIAPEPSLERQEIRVALDDLKILKALSRKYG
jgi:hypothetical protein